MATARGGGALERRRRRFSICASVEFYVVYRYEGARELLRMISARATVSGIICMPTMTIINAEELSIPGTQYRYELWRHDVFFPQIFLGFWAVHANAEAAAALPGAGCCRCPMRMRVVDGHDAARAVPPVHHQPRRCRLHTRDPRPTAAPLPRPTFRGGSACGFGAMSGLECSARGTSPAKVDALRLGDEADQSSSTSNARHRPPLLRAIARARWWRRGVAICAAVLSCLARRRSIAARADGRATALRATGSGASNELFYAAMRRGLFRAGRVSQGGALQVCARVGVGILMRHTLPIAWSRAP